MAQNHAALTDPDLHEPKGVAAATSGTTYHADGAGSGSFSFPIHYLSCVLDDISTAGSAYVVCPFAGTVTSIATVIDGALGTADAGLTFKAHTSTITDGAITVTQSGSAAGDIDTSTPSGNNTVTANQVLQVTTDGASTNTVKCVVTFTVQRTA